ncbi:MAG: M48 family metalloprotease [Acidobacteria bacterium]|nr:M48 family metalloprotease [Acidobacteriota bacterium]
MIAKIVPKAILVFALLFATGGCTVNPVTGKSQLDLMGEAQELELGKSLYPRYTQSSLGTVQEPRLQGYVDRVGLRLAAVSHRPNLPWEYNAVNDPAVNAYALPGGKISITRGLLARMDSEDELAGVLGHETGHVTARHAAVAYTRSLLTQLALVGGMAYMEVNDTKNRNLYAFGGMLGAQLMLAHYSRAQESQADELGYQYMVRAGYNPEGMAGLMEVLQSEQKREPNFVERMFASHPMTTDRLAMARQEIAAAPAEVRNRPFRTRAFLEQTHHVRESRPAYDRLAEARRLLGKDEASKALPLLRQSVGEWPDDGLLRAFLAGAESGVRDRAHALRDAARAARDARGIWVVQSLAARLFLDASKYREALSYVEAADRILPDVADVELMRGRALEGLGRSEEAARSYKKVQRMAPDSEAATEASKRLRRLGINP